MLRDSLRIRRELGERVAIAEDISRLARTFASAGEAETAARLLSSSRALYEELGASAPSFGTDRNEETLAIVRAQLDDASFDAAWDEGLRLTLDEAIALALDAKLVSGLYAFTVVPRAPNFSALRRVSSEAERA
jgi:hypothetical protein